MEHPEGRSRPGQSPPVDLHLGLIHRSSTDAEDLLRLYAKSKEPDLSQRPMSVFARALTHAVLVAATGSNDWTFGQAATGAPVARTGTGSVALSISLSHSGDWAACAVSFEGEVGVDVELHKQSRDFTGIAEYAFGKSEREIAARFGAERFYAVWTLREAIAKATGKGLRQVTDSVDRVAEGPFGESRWSNLDGENWWLMHEYLTTGLSLAVALRLGVAEPRPIALNRWRCTS